MNFTYPCRLCDHDCDLDDPATIKTESNVYHSRCWELLGKRQWRHSDGRHRRQVFPDRSDPDWQHDSRRDAEAEMWANGGPF